MSQKVLYWVTFFAILLSPILAKADGLINISSKVCNYSFAIPNGWDTIPSQLLKYKVKDISAIDFAIYNKNGQNFEDDYMVVQSIPTLEPLIKYTHDKIFETIANGIRLNEKLAVNDSMTLETINLTKRYEFPYYHITSLSYITKNEKTICNIQDNVLTKFGYVSVGYYKIKSGNELTIDFPFNVSSHLAIKEEYKYYEPQSTSVFTLKNILISIGIGFLTLCLVIVTDKKKHHQ